MNAGVISKYKGNFVSAGASDATREFAVREQVKHRGLGYDTGEKTKMEKWNELEEQLYKKKSGNQRNNSAHISVKTPNNTSVTSSGRSRNSNPKSQISLNPVSIIGNVAYGAANAQILHRRPAFERKLYREDEYLEWEHNNAYNAAHKAYQSGLQEEKPWKQYDAIKTFEMTNRANELVKERRRIELNYKQKQDEIEWDKYQNKTMTLAGLPIVGAVAGPLYGHFNDPKLPQHYPKIPYRPETFTTPTYGQ